MKGAVVAWSCIGIRLIPRRRQQQPTPVLLPGESHGRRSLVGCSPWGREESDTTKRLHFHFHALEEEMATHSSVLAWRIPGTEESVGLPSMGLHRVGHDWGDLAAAARLILTSEGLFNCQYKTTLCVCMLSHFSRVQLFVMLWTPLSMGFSRQEYWSGLSRSLPGFLPDPGIEPMFLKSPALAGRFFNPTVIWEAHKKQPCTVQFAQYSYFQTRVFHFWPFLFCSLKKKKKKKTQTLQPSLPENYPFFLHH